MSGYPSSTGSRWRSSPISGSGRWAGPASAFSDRPRPRRPRARRV